MQLSVRLETWANGKSLLILAGIMIGLGVMMLSPLGPSDELRILAGGVDVPDTQIGRSVDGFYRQLAAYGPDGRRLYLTRVSPVDLLIPAAQAIFLAVAISLASRKVISRGSHWQMLNLVPLAAMLADYLENASMIILLLAYPVRLDGLAAAAAMFTSAKILFIVFSLVILVALLLFRGIVWFRGEVGKNSR
jgi:hypothetical protein